MKVYPVQTHYTNSSCACKPTFKGKNFATFLKGIDYENNYSPDKWFKFFQECMEKVVQEPGFCKIDDLFDKFAAVKKCEDLEKLLSVAKDKHILVNKKISIAKDDCGTLIYFKTDVSKDFYYNYIKFVSDGISASFGRFRDWKRGTSSYLAGTTKFMSVTILGKTRSVAGCLDKFF